MNLKIIWSEFEIISVWSAEEVYALDSFNLTLSIK